MNEARVQSSLQISSGNLQYQSKPTTFNANVATAFGPVPGAFTVALAGTDVDLSKLSSTGGFCIIRNLDPTNFVSYGIFDHGTNRYYPLFEVLPGESYVARTSRVLGYEYGAGTGTHLASGETWRFKADTAPCVVVVEAFTP